MEDGVSNPQKRRRLATIDLDDQRVEIDANTLENLYVSFISSCSQSLRLVECEEFRTFLYYLHPGVDEWLPSSGHTVNTWVKRQYQIQSEKQQKKLQNALSDIHIMVDLWSSPNHQSILGITAVYVNEQKKHEKCVLAIKTVLGGHDGANLSRYVIEAIQKWNLSSKLGFIVMDNATSNDRLIKVVAKELVSTYQIRYDALHHRIRCQGHIINLVAHSFLFATKDEDLEGDEEDLRTKATPEQMKEWRRKGK